eukprot:4817042-Prymnesium_polylepis.1
MIAYWELHPAVARAELCIGQHRALRHRDFVSAMRHAAYDVAGRSRRRPSSDHLQEHCAPTSSTF